MVMLLGGLCMWERGVQTTVTRTGQQCIRCGFIFTANIPELDVGEPDGEERQERHQILCAHHLLPRVPQPLQHQVLIMF